MEICTQCYVDDLWQKADHTHTHTHTPISSVDCRVRLPSPRRRFGLNPSMTSTTGKISVHLFQYAFTVNLLLFTSVSTMPEIVMYTQNMHTTKLYLHVMHTKLLENVRNVL